MSCPCCAPYPFAEPEASEPVRDSVNTDGFADDSPVVLPLSDLAEVNAVFGLLEIGDNEEVEDYLRIDAYSAVLAHLKPEIF